MLKIALCDDNGLQCDIMHDILTDYAARSEVPVEYTAFSSGSELIDRVRSSGGFDIYILDLVMPGMNGMELASTLRLMKDNGKIIFLTSTVEYAVASYDVNAFYFMLKPVDRDKLFKTLDSAVREIVPGGKCITVKANRCETAVNISDIMYIELVNRAPIYHLSGGRTVEGVTLRGSFREHVAPVLEDERFVLCGVSSVVNIDCVDALDSDSVLLRDGTQLFPPKSAYPELRRVWKSKTE